MHHVDLVKAVAALAASDAPPDWAAGSPHALLHLAANEWEGGGEGGGGGGGGGEARFSRCEPIFASD
jgi:hypothetical protein